MILDHLGLQVRDFSRSRAFYQAALAPLGIVIVEQSDSYAGFNVPSGRGGFWIAVGDPPGPVHVAFAAKDHGQVRAFYEAALAAGGHDNGPPGLRPQYHPDYYGAFIRDPDGHNIEAVCRTPETRKSIP
jgi:catechol 2,3-dioxygenase-like lactoylglutathione lyase family enzyme